MDKGCTINVLSMYNWISNAGKAILLKTQEALQKQFLTTSKAST
jgi:hypothetical protein